MALKDWLKSIVALFYPEVCIVCGQPLSSGEELLCHRCNMDLPRTHLHLKRENVAEQLFWGKAELQKASSYFYYQRGSDFTQILHQIGRAHV